MTTKTPTHLPALDAPFHIRPFQPDTDFPPLMALLAAIEAVDRSGEVTTEAEQREQLTWPGHDLTQDRWVVVAQDAPGILLGWGDSWRMTGNSYADISVAVHPAYRRRGFGRALLAYVLDRAGRQGATTVGVYVDAGHMAAQRFLAQHGFQHQSAFVMLHMAQTTQQQLQLPAGYSIYAADQRTDAQTLAAILNASYGDRFGHKIVGAEQVQKMLASVPPEQWLLLAAPDQAIIGVCRIRLMPAAEHEAASGYLDAPGVIAAYRQPALYQLLATAGLELLHQRQVYAITIESWGDDPAVIASYQALGFTIQRHSLAYQYTLS
jgi:ribosomal protein S18 acetylase RimI-like enzyme